MREIQTIFVTSEILFAISSPIDVKYLLKELAMFLLPLIVFPLSEKSDGNICFVCFLSLPHSLWTIACVSPMRLVQCLCLSLLMHDKKIGNARNTSRLFINQQTTHTNEILADERIYFNCTGCLPQLIEYLYIAMLGVTEILARHEIKLRFTYLVGCLLICDSS